MIITPTPESYLETSLYKLLVDRSKASDGLAEKQQLSLMLQDHYSKFDDETIEMLGQAYISKTLAEPLTEDLIGKINQLLPATTPYDEDIYKEISNKLNINPYQIRRYIKAMTFLGKIKPK